LPIFFFTLEISFCLFHFGKSLYKKVVSLGLSEKYNTDKNFKLLLKCFNSLAFVPPHSVIKEFEKLKQKLLKEYQEQNVKMVVVYFEQTYIKGHTFTIGKLNGFERVLANISLTKIRLKDLIMA
jgi:hypothetical protein